MTSLLYVAFIAHNNHYNAIQEYQQTTIQSSSDPSFHGVASSNSIKCRCGRGGSRTSMKASCSISKSYKSRCPCLAGRRKCTNECKCNSCEKPFGIKSGTQSTTKGMTHRRKKQHSTTRVKSIEFLVSRNQNIKQGSYGPLKKHYKSYI